MVPIELNSNISSSQQSNNNKIEANQDKIEMKKNLKKTLNTELYMR